MQQASIGDAELALVDEGTGPPLLLVHGFPLDHRMWRHQIAALAGRFRVLAPDLRGFGQSPLVSQGPTPHVLTMAQFADDLGLLLAARGIQEPVTFCGLSMGGYIGWQFYERHRARVARWILCDTRAVNDTETVARGRLLAAQQVLDEGPRTLASSMLEKLIAPATRTEQTGTVAELTAMMHAASRQGMAAALRGMAERVDYRPRLGAIDIPTLVVVGEEDTISTVSEMRDLAERIPGATLVEIAGAGHMAPLEKPREVNQAIAEFLARTA